MRFIVPGMSFRFRVRVQQLKSQLQQLKIQLQKLKIQLQQLKIQLQQLKIQLQQQLYSTGASFQRAAAIQGPAGPRALGPGPLAQIQLQQLKSKL